jgi:lipopolysaccharide biosynthesis regulator YciM
MQRRGEIAGPDIYDLPLDLVRRVLRFARLAETASLLDRAETIMHQLWEDESDRGELAPDILDLLQQTANEIEQAAGTLAEVTYQPGEDKP